VPSQALLTLARVSGHNWPMTADSDAPSWERIVTAARALREAADKNDVRPQDGAHIVRMILEFDDTLHPGVPALPEK
jgi:hypothetical protein